MRSDKVFPLLLIVLQICAGIMYVPSGNWRMCVYWFAAAVLNIAVTF